MVDPNEPPLPAKITVEQAAKFAESIARGTRDGGAIVRKVIGDKIRELV